MTLPRLTIGQRKALEFIAMHPGTRSGPLFTFDAPEPKRAPFRVETIYRLIQMGLVTQGKQVQLTDSGRAVLEQR